MYKLVTVHISNVAGFQQLDPDGYLVPASATVLLKNITFL